MKMILTSISSIILTILVGSNSNTNNDDSILWKSYRKLKWIDFQGIPDSVSTYKAITSINVSVKNTVYENNKLEFNIPCYFRMKTSWSKNKTSQELLKHEQLHFDIAELIARKIRKGYMKHVSNDINQTQIDLKNIFNEFYNNELDSLNYSYDYETNHGIIKNKQKEWETKIAKELKALDKYSNTRVIIKRVKN